MLTIRSYNKPHSPTLNWSSLQHLLETAIPHVLIILDCCFAANAARDTTEGTTKELLAACGRENKTSGVGIRSFTSALIDELRHFGLTPFTVAMLHSRLVTIRWRLAFTPIYALLSEHGGHSIEIGPLPLNMANSSSMVSVDSQERSELMNSSSPATISSTPTSQRSSSITAADTRVLLVVSIAQDAVHDICQWKNWLTSQTPWDVTKVNVRVESVYESHSTMLLVSLPIFAWDSLPSNAAYRFVGFIRSNNLQQPRSSSRLAAKNMLSQSHQATTTSPPMSARNVADFKAKTLSKRAPPPPPNLDLDSSIIPQKRAVPHSESSSPPEKPPSLRYSVNLDSSVERETDTPRFADAMMSTSPSRRSRAQRSRDTASYSASPVQPSSTSIPWDHEADNQLLQARKQGMNWEAIARHYFPFKTVNACRKRHERLQDKIHHEEPWRPSNMHRQETLGPSKLDAMANAYIQCRDHIWKVVAEHLDENWQDVESKVNVSSLVVLNGTNNFSVYGARVRKSAQPESSSQSSQQPQEPKRHS